LLKGNLTIIVIVASIALDEEESFAQVMVDVGVVKSLDSILELEECESTSQRSAVSEVDIVP